MRRSRDKGSAVSSSEHPVQPVHFVQVLICQLVVSGVRKQKARKMGQVSRTEEQMEAKQKRSSTRADEDNVGGGMTEARKGESSCEKGCFGHIPK